MARKRPGVVAVRRIVAGMCIFVGLFVACFGLGNGRQSIMLAGLAIMVLAAATRVATSFRRTPREWWKGVGRVQEVSEPPEGARFGRCSLQLLVQVPGLPEEIVVVHDSRVPAAQWPRPGQELPLQVASDDVRNVRVLWRDFTPVEMPAEAVWGTDEPEPSPATPPGSHLDPSPVIDFDLDNPPTGPIEPVAPIDRNTVEPVPTGAAETSPADEGRVDATASLADERQGEPAASGDDGRGDSAAPPDEIAQLVPAVPSLSTATDTTGRVPRPRPSPYRSSQPATVAAGSPVAGSEPGADDPYAGGPAAGDGATAAINGLGVTMIVGELARSVAFYRDQLGFSEVDTGQDSTVLAAGDTRLVLRQASDLGTVKHRLVHLNLEVSDIDTVYADLKASGVRFTYPPRAVDQTSRQELWAAAFRDPDGHGIALTQWRPPRTPGAV